MRVIPSLLQMGQTSGKCVERAGGKDAALHALERDRHQQLDLRRKRPMSSWRGIVFEGRLGRMDERRAHEAVVFTILPIASTIGGWPTARPIRQPLMLYDLLKV